MFTGIVERTARVLSLADRPGGRWIRLRVEDANGLPEWRPAALGESIAVDGVCLTVVERASLSGGEAVSFDAVPETLQRTTLGDLKVGDEVNVERSLRVGDSFGGHYVTGHVDGVGVVRSRRREGDQVLFEIGLAADLVRQVLPKGSIALDGVSLTVIEVDRTGRWFSFAAIPHTMERTALKNREAGSRVNVETDAFGKWVLHALKESHLGHPGPLDAGHLDDGGGR